MKHYLLILAGLFVFAPQLSFGDDFDIKKHPDFIELKEGPRLVLDIRYATKNNFVGRPVYPSARAYLHREAFSKFQSAANDLGRRYPQYKFIVFDGLRPRSVQWIFWNVVKGTPQEKYVADPVKGSVHNYGFALDLSIVDGKGKELDMGTPYDDFTKLAEPQTETANLKAGKLTKKQIDNRLILRRIMTRAGFHQLEYEWWHYDGVTRDVLDKNYKIVE